MARSSRGAFLQRSGADALAGSHDATDRLVGDINRVWNRSAVRTLVAVGALILDACYGGDVERWRSREANGHLKRLVCHQALPFGRKTVYLALHFHDLSVRLSEPQFLSRLGVGHVRAVLGLPSEDQELLLRQALDTGWTIADLTARAAQVRKSRGKRRTGRPPVAPRVRLERSIRRHVADLEKLIAEESLIECCSPTEVGLISSTLNDLKEQLGAALRSAEHRSGPRRGSP